MLLLYIISNPMLRTFVSNMACNTCLKDFIKLTSLQIKLFD